MATKWGLRKWDSFRWAGSPEFEALLERKDGITTKPRIIWKLDAGDQDISKYLLDASAISREKERAPDRITAGDMTFVMDNTSGVFTERNSSSFLNDVTYHNTNITVEIGIELKNGTFEYRKVATMKVRSVTFSTDEKTATILCYDLIARLLSERVNRRPTSMVPVLNSANTGDGAITEIDTKPFVTVVENWTLTCTTRGGDGVAIFDIVGSVSGDIGDATDGTEFENATTGGIKFTINEGDTEWEVGDEITFSTVQMMEWSAINPIKIIWSILTGTIWDSGANETFKDRTPKLDSTQSNANTDIDYASLQKAVTEVADLFTLKGFLQWDYELSEAIEEIIFHFLGAINIDASGRLYVKVFIPEQGANPPAIKDSQQISSFSYQRDMRHMINRVEMKFRKRDLWPWTDEDEEDSLDGIVVFENDTSFSDFGQWFGSQEPIISRWFNATAAHVNYMGPRLIDKYGQPPIRMTVETALRALDFEIGDVIAVTDAKHEFTNYPVEVVMREFDLISKPKSITMELEDTRTVGFTWGFLGSSSDEGDEISPQAASFDDASESDKGFCYLSQTGGSGSSGPDYFMY